MNTGIETKRTKAPAQFSALLLRSGFFAVAENWSGDPWDKWVLLFDKPRVLLGEWDTLEHAEIWARALCNSRPVAAEVSA